MNRSLIIIATLLAIATQLSACRPLWEAPIFTERQAGSTQTFPLDVPRPADAALTSVRLRLAPGSGTLAVAGGAGNPAQGTVTTNVPAWRPTIAMGAGTVRIDQGAPDQPGGIPTGAVNRWDLQLAADVTDLRIECPAGDYTLDFTGAPPPAAHITVAAGAGHVRLITAVGTVARVAVAGGPRGVATAGSWTTSGDDTYAAGGAGSPLVVTVEIGAGGVTLVSK